MAYRLSRELDYDDWQLNSHIFRYLNSFGMHSIDRFATMRIAQPSCANAGWCDLKCEAVDCIPLNDNHWLEKLNYCNSSWTAMEPLVDKLCQSGAAARGGTRTFIAPHSPARL
jgi:hypothetical protein